MIYNYLAVHQLLKLIHLNFFVEESNFVQKVLELEMHEITEVCTKPSFQEHRCH